MDLLEPRHGLFVPDVYGAGKSSDWHLNREISLQDEVRFIGPVLIAAGMPQSFFGHWYGAAVVLSTAVANPCSTY